MNLVIDDAVEVKLATKTEEETRRQLGNQSTTPLSWMQLTLLAQDKFS
jgi:hypothetical protein